MRFASFVRLRRAAAGRSTLRSAANAFAQRMKKDANGDLPAAVKRGYALALGRQPDAEELDTSVAFILAQTESYKQAGTANGEDRALANFAQTLLSLNEFSYVE